MSSPRLKRKLEMDRHEENESDSDTDDDAVCMMKKCLDVKLPKNFDPNKIPESGEEYLQYVMYEAKRCKKYTRAEIDLKKFDANLSLKVETDGSLRTPDAVKPSLDWQESKLEQFTKFRDDIQSRMSEDPSEHAVHSSHWIDRINTNYPGFSEVAELTQDSKLTLFNIVADQIEGDVKSETGSWIYALLATFQIPLSPEICHALRDFARKCIRIRAKFPEDCPRERYVPFNLFICIIARYFKQFDLCDD